MRPNYLNYGTTTKDKHSTTDIFYRNPENERLEVVDALRGIALCAIVIIHCLEHYNLYFIPENAPQWLTTIDKGIWQTTWFLLAGKAFSAFSLLSDSVSSSNMTMRNAGGFLSVDASPGECYCW